MAPGIHLVEEQQTLYQQLTSYGEETMVKMANSYPFACLSSWDLGQFPTRLSPPPPPSCKKMRTADGGSGAGTFLINGGAIDHENQSDGYRKLRFRDHISSFKQKIRALEVVEENGDCEAAEEVGGGSGDEMRLVQLLISCAEAVACRDRAQATVLLRELKTNALTLGTSFQRVASCFVQGLSDRLALVQPLGAVGITGPTAGLNSATSIENEAALALAYELCPYVRFGHFVANAAILEAFEGESLVHVVDPGMTMGLAHGPQWQQLLHGLAAQDGPPLRRVRITGVGPCSERLHAIGDDLEACARSLGINLEFFAIESSLENLRVTDFCPVDKGEVLAVNSILQLHCVVKESRGALNSVLQMIRELNPRVLALVEQDSSHNGPFFLGRFMEALHYYSAIFDSLDAGLPRYDTKRAKVEQFYFAEEIKNIVSCEGPARVERHERVDQWRRRMSRAGFQPTPIKMMAQAKQWLAKGKTSEGYTVAEEKGCLVLGWKSKPIIATSCWKC